MSSVSKLVRGLLSGGTGSKRRTRSANPKAALALQPLEQREVPAALTAVLSGGQLTVTGTDAADSIIVRQDTGGRMYVNGVQILNAQTGAAAASVPAAQVASVVVDARGGNDTVWLVDIGGAGAATDRNRLINVSAGDGNDFVGMGLGRNTVSGGNGADDLEGYVSGGAYTVAGDTGDDVIDLSRVNAPLVSELSAGDGNDSVHGSQGADRIFGGAGNDYLWGAGGNDVIDGGLGNDYIWGDAGDDRLTGGAGTNTLNGGAGTDTFYDAFQGGIDKISGTEATDAKASAFTDYLATAPLATVQSLGAGTGPVTTMSDGVGRMQTYSNGFLMWSPSTGAHAVTGVFAAKWSSGGGLSTYGYATAESRQEVIPTQPFSITSQPFERAVLTYQPGGGVIIGGQPPNIVGKWIAGSTEFTEMNRDSRFDNAPTETGITVRGAAYKIIAYSLGSLYVPGEAGAGFGAGYQGYVAGMSGWLIAPGTGWSQFSMSGGGDLNDLNFVSITVNGIIADDGTYVISVSTAFVDGDTRVHGPADIKFYYGQLADYTPPTIH